MFIREKGKTKWKSSWATVYDTI